MASLGDMVFDMAQGPLVSWAQVFILGLLVAVISSSSFLLPPFSPSLSFPSFLFQSSRYSR